MSELDQFKINEIKSFRDKLISTGMISQSMVTGLEDVIGSNPITSVKRIQHFTGNESHYGCQEVINILNNLLDSEAGTESVSATAYRNADTMLGITINLLNYILPPEVNHDKLSNSFNLYDKFFKTPLDTPYLSNVEDFRGLKLGNLTGQEFFTILSGLTLTEDGLVNSLTEEFGTKIRFVKEIIRRTEGINRLTEDDGSRFGGSFTFTDEAEFARAIYKLAFESIITPEELVSIPGYISNSVNYNLYTINTLLNRSADVIKLIDNARSICTAARALYRNEELYNNMSLTYLIAAVCLRQNTLTGSTVTKTSRVADVDKARDFIKLNTKSLASMVELKNKLYPDESDCSQLVGHSVEYVSVYTQPFIEGLFSLINSNDKYVKMAMSGTDRDTKFSYGYPLTRCLYGISYTEDKSDALDLLDNYLRLINLL